VQNIKAAAPTSKASLTFGNGLLGPEVPGPLLDNKAQAHNLFRESRQIEIMIPANATVVEQQTRRIQYRARWRKAEEILRALHSRVQTMIATEQALSDTELRKGKTGSKVKMRRHAANIQWYRTMDVDYLNPIQSRFPRVWH
jgi:hypothetical protein